MGNPVANLGLSLFADRLYYSINTPGEHAHLAHIGSFDFNFDVVDAVSTQHPNMFPHLQKIVGDLVETHNIKSIRVLTYPANECWTSLPKVVYDNADEREDHLTIIMKGVAREDIEPTWHSVSKPDYKFLGIRRRAIMAGFDLFTDKVATSEFVSDFELAGKWSAFNKPGGSFLMIGCHKNVISITSFLLGQFRAATFIKYDQVEDLPYHWLQQAAHSSWLKGLYEHTYLFGVKSHEVNQTLHQFWDKSTKVIKLNALGDIGVFAEEQTYGFDLAAAFPAILLSLDI